MAEQNFSEDKQHNTFGDLSCRPDFTSGLPNGQLTFLLVLNSFLSVTAFLGNALILVALHKKSSLHPPSKLLLRSLATTDLCVGLIAEPLDVISWITVAKGQRNIYRYATSVRCTTANIFCGVSVLTLTAISVDRLLALLLGLRYKQFVTLKRTYVIVITLWVLPALLSAMWFWKPFINVLCRIIGIPLCLIISIFSYTKIFLTLRHHQNQVHVQQPNHTNQLNIARYKKAVSTAIWLQLTLVACYLPYGVVTALLTNGGRSSSVSNAWNYAVTLVFLNSSLNPILFCWKMEEVRQAAKNTIRQVLCLCFSG